MGQEPRAAGAHLRSVIGAPRRLVLLALCALCAAAVAQVAPQPAASSAAPASRPAEPALADPVYQDRLIEGLPPQLEDDATAAQRDYNADGWARQLRVETRIGQDSFNNTRLGRTAGVALYGLIETPNYGVISIDGQTGGNPSGGTLTLRQRSMPIAGGWLVNNEIGVIGTPAPGITQRASRVYVPNYLLQGASTEWLSPGQGLQLQASAGQPGRLDGSVVSRFERLPGTVSSAGVQLDTAPWSFALRAADARGVSLSQDASLFGGPVDARSAQFAVRREIGNQSLQANLVSTNSSSGQRSQTGVWADGETRDGPRSYSAGLFWLDPNLSWAGQPMASDAAGGYLRSTWQTRQWSAEAGLDLLRSISEPTNTGYFLTSSGRWRYSRTVSFGAGAAVRSFNGQAWNGYGEVRWQNGLGNTGVRLDLTTELQQRRTRQATLDHDWRVSAGWSLATSLTAGQTDFFGDRQNLWAAAVSVNAPVTSSVIARGNFTTERSGAASSRVGVNAGLSWRLTPRWSLDGNYNRNRGRSQLNQSIDPLATPLPFGATTTDSSSLFVALRWEESAGTRSIPLGGQALQGGGSVEGRVFLDANRNGRQEAGEGGAAGVTVFLDNRYPTRTDAQGRYEFPFVASGSHAITVLRETLPLPWIPAGESTLGVDVPVRGSLRLDIGVVRQGND